MSAQQWRRFYAYQMTFAAVAQDTQAAPQVMQVTNDAPFFITSIQAEVSDGAGDFQDPTGATLLLTDNGSNYPLFFAPVPLSTISGSGSLPFYLPIPYPIRPNSSLTGNLYNGTSLAGAATFILTFSGYKLFGASSGDAPASS